ncbi:hypothetical protein A2U01_0024035, partial [Trifolium medium]|nr:hypothetical protein [Trifolium medium]
KLPAKANVDRGKYCCYHRSYGHLTEGCVHLKDAIEILIQKGYARKYVKDGERETREAQMAIEAPTLEEDDNRAAMPTAYAISRLEDFLPPPDADEEGIMKQLTAHMDGSWENFPKAIVISGGGFNKTTIGSIKKKFEELKSVCFVNPMTVSSFKDGSIPLAFYREEVPGGSPNYQIPLLVRARMANFDVHRILVNQGSSCDVMYSGLFKTLQLAEKNLVPYVGADLQGFNGSTTKPWGYVDLIVTFSEDKAMKAIKVQFLVVDCPSLYNCIIGRT